MRRSLSTCPATRRRIRRQPMAVILRGESASLAWGSLARGSRPRSAARGACPSSRAQVMAHLTCGRDGPQTPRAVGRGGAAPPGSGGTGPDRLLVGPARTGRGPGERGAGPEDDGQGLVTTQDDRATATSGTRGAEVGEPLEQRLQRDLALHPRERGAEAEVDAAAEREVVAGVGARDVEDVRIGEHRSEEHTSELQSRQYLVCRLLLEKKKKKTNMIMLILLIT